MLLAAVTAAAFSDLYSHEPRHDSEDYHRGVREEEDDYET